MIDDCDDIDDEEADLLRAAAEGDSPIRLRKLFGSPEHEGESEGGAAQQTKKEAGSSSAEDEEKKGAVEAATGLLGGEISAETFDADAYLLEAVGFSPDSKCCSPVTSPLPAADGRCKRRTPPACDAGPACAGERADSAQPMV